MRTFDIIDAEIKAATAISDLPALKTLAEEMVNLGTTKAKASGFDVFGSLNQMTGNYVSALENYSLALRWFTEIRDRPGIARVTSNIGVVNAIIGNYAQALECLMTALQAFTEQGNRSFVARINGNIANLYSQTGNYLKAIDYFNESLRLHTELEEKSYVATVMSNLSSIYSSMGDHAGSMEYLQRALTIHRELNHLAGIAYTTAHIGSVHKERSEYVQALEHFRRALALHEELGDRAESSRLVGDLIETLLRSGLHDEAEELLEKQTTMLMVSPPIMAEHLANRALLDEYRNRLDSSAEHLRNAGVIVRESGNIQLQAKYHLRQRDLSLKMGDFAGYVEHNTDYVRIMDDISSNQTIQRMTMMDAERRIEAERREREREKALLYGALPRTVADRMLKGERVNGDHHELASVIFLDIVGFTHISDRLPPSHVVHLLECVFSTLDGVSKEYGVTKIKTIGDCYMAVSFDDVHSAALCALRMRTAIDNLVVAMPAELEDSIWTTDMGEIKVRIGVHSGPITAGVIGTERLQYDVWGDTVNVASRLESTGEPGRIHISKEFAEYIARHPQSEDNTDAFIVTMRGEVNIKGKGVITTYWLEAR